MRIGKAQIETTPSDKWVLWWSGDMQYVYTSDFKYLVQIAFAPNDMYTYVTSA